MPNAIAQLDLCALADAIAAGDITSVDHGGMQGWWSEKIYEDCLHVAAARDNVYL